METLKKRINTLTTYLILLCIVTFVYGLHKLDSKEKFKQFQIVNGIENFLDKPPTIYPFQYGNYAKLNSPDRARLVTHVSFDIQKILRDVGIKRDTTGSKPYQYPLGLFYPEDDSIRGLSVNQPKSVEERTNEIVKLSVSEAISNYQRYFRPFKIYFSTSFDTTHLTGFLNMWYHLKKHGSLKEFPGKSISLETFKNKKYLREYALLFYSCEIVAHRESLSELKKILVILNIRTATNLV